ncbi:MAG: hypothetical protein U9Q30_02975 [Campylobacterota bacterium]|nr:hypothetical protein [Campylobacterota bacterium]
MYKKGFVYIYSIVISTSFFIGCSNTQNVVYLDNNIFKKDNNSTIIETTPDIIDNSSIKSNKRIIIRKEEDTIISSIIKDNIVDENISKIIRENNDTIAILLSSSKIGKYALETTTAINTFLLYKNSDFNIEIYDIDKIDIEDINKSFNSFNINKIMGLIPMQSINILNKISQNENSNIYLPLVNKNDADIDKLNNKETIIFGGIDYKKQFEKLKDYANSNNLVELYGASAIGNYLHNTLGEKSVRLNRKIDDQSARYKNILREFRRKNYSIILNTSIVKSSILLSQIYARNVHTKHILSTQLNYTPLLFSLTQRNDRRKFIVANSIGYIPKDLIVYNNIMKENISYNWASYSTIVGLEYLINKNISIFKDLSLENNQIIYPIKLYKANRRSFELIK